MSYQATNWAYAVPIKAPMKPVLVALADMADEHHSCFPSQQRLADMTGYDVRTVRRALEGLEQADLLRRAGRRDARGHRTSDRYHLPVAATGSPTGQRVLPDRESYRTESPSLPDRESIPTGQRVLGTINEPSENHQQRAAVKLTKSHPHRYDGNARTALDTLRSERSLPLALDELVTFAYDLGAGDPWAGYLEVKSRTTDTITDARNPGAVLRSRLARRGAA